MQSGTAENSVPAVQYELLGRFLYIFYIIKERG